MAEDNNTEPENDEEEEDEQGIPYQMEVFFDELPEIDGEALARFVNETDPDEQDPCTIQAVEHEPGGILGACSFVAGLGDFHMAIMIHNVPSPAAEMIDQAALPATIKERLKGHQSFALLTNAGGEHYAPYESVIFLYKVALGLCRQGAIGASHFHAGLYYPADVLLKILEAPARESGDPSMTLWKSIREEHEPLPLLFRIQPFASRDGSKKYLCTRGFSHCGFPDLVAEFEDRDEADGLDSLFCNAFQYMMENGPVIRAGHTMGYDENVAFRFSEVPDNMEFPFGVFEMLMVTREKAEDS